LWRTKDLTDELVDHKNIRNEPKQKEREGEEMIKNWCSVPQPSLTNFKVYFKLYNVVFGLFGLELTT
jgi:hypothetical protein